VEKSWTKVVLLKDLFLVVFEGIVDILKAFQTSATDIFKNVGTSAMGLGKIIFKSLKGESIGEQLIEALSSRGSCFNCF